MTREQAVKFLRDRPYEFGHMVGFRKLTPLHNGWIREMVTGKDDATLQAHRGSYKTTCVSISLAIIMVLLPNRTILFMRKTDSDTKEIVGQVKKILLSQHMAYFVNTIYGVGLKTTKDSKNELSTNLMTRTTGTSQLTGVGIGGSLTGKHYDLIFTDDIVNLNDRISKAERDRTKLVYQELQNILNPDGRFFNTGTPWHVDDAFSLMPEPMRYDYKATGLLSDEKIQELKDSMAPSLFAANYELRHIASDDVIFTDPKTGADPALVLNGNAHLDSAFYGEDYTAFSVMAFHDGTYYIYGRLWRKHVEDCYKELISLSRRFLCKKMYTELNADKGMVARDLKRLGLKMAGYQETMNKHIKIVTYLKAIWSRVVFVEGTDEAYIRQITDYTEEAEHDDAPDSAACLARLLYYKTNRKGDGGDVHIPGLH